MVATRVVQWPLIVLPAALVGAFEYWRHAIFEGLREPWGTLAAALIASAASMLYYLYTLSIVERLTASLHEEKARQAVMHERDRIAGQLHDSLAQTLFFLNAELERASAALQRGDVEAAARSVAEAREGVAFSHQDLRETIAALQRAEWDKPLVPSLRNMATAFYRQSGIDIDVSLPETAPDLPPALSESLYRLAQEALTNVRKHSGAKRARLVLAVEGDSVRLEVADDGAGIPAERRKDPGGFGLAEMERLARSAGGSLEIESSGAGTAIRFTAPVPPGKGRTV